MDINASVWGAVNAIGAYTSSLNADILISFKKDGLFSRWH